MAAPEETSSPKRSLEAAKALDASVNGIELKSSEKPMGPGFVRRPGAVIHYLTFGNKVKPCVLFVHGGGQNNSAWWRTIPNLMGEFFCISMSMRSWGNSLVDDDDVANVDPSLMGGDALAVMDAEGVSSAQFVCQSTGGIVAVRAAFESPERVERLIMSNSIAGFSDGPGPGADVAILSALWDPTENASAVSAEFYARRDALAKEITKSMPWLPHERLSVEGAGRAVTPYHSAFKAYEPALAHLYDTMMLQNVQALRIGTFKKSNSLINNPVMVTPSEFRSKYKGPVHFISSTYDGSMPWEFAEYRAAQMGDNATFHLFEGVGHASYYEAPDMYNPHLVDVLRGNYMDPIVRFGSLEMLLGGDDDEDDAA